MAYECNCDPADNGSGWMHHHWCDTYRPTGMTDEAWALSLATHPIFGDGK